MLPRGERRNRNQTTIIIESTAADAPGSHALDARSADHERLAVSPGKATAMSTTYQHIPLPMDEAKEAKSSHIVYPEWPTSKPGPAVTPPPAGQRPQARRSDQMVYDCYDQERGMACEVPARPVMREHKGKMDLPDDHFLDMISETEAEQRWLDDGGTSDKKPVSEIGDKTPLSLVRP